METKELIEYLERNCWSRKWNTTNDNYEDWEYERSYADFIYDNLIIWFNEKKIDVSYNDIGWGYTNIINYSFTYEEFIEWSKSIYN